MCAQVEESAKRAIISVAVQFSFMKQSKEESHCKIRRSLLDFTKMKPKLFVWYGKCYGADLQKISTYKINSKLNSISKPDL